MQIVIDIPEESYKLLKNKGVDWLGAEHILSAVANGTPLSKGHGRLIDESKITFCGCNGYLNYMTTNAPTIIEADMESEVSDASSH